MSELLPSGRTQFVDANGDPLVGASLYFYVPGTATFKDTYQDPGLTVANTNPVILDELGSAVAFGDGQYRQILKDAEGNTLWDEVVGTPVSVVVDDDFVSSDVTADPIGSSGIEGLNFTAGEAISKNDAVCINTDGLVYQANASSTGPLACNGFAAAAAVAGALVPVQINGIVGGMTGISEGVWYYLSTNAGQLSSEGAIGAGDIWQPVGLGLPGGALLMQVDVPLLVAA